MSGSKPHFYFLTLFPATIEVWLTTSILGRARESGLFDFSVHQLRDFSQDKHRSVDDSAYGGGGGMVMRLEPLVAATESLTAGLSKEECRIVYFSPAGRRMDQALINGLARGPVRKYIFVCGHYEGVDQRFLDNWVDLEISLGDFVLTGGELPAVAFADALIRQLDGALHHDNASESESFSLTDPQTGQVLLEYPHYTRPAEFRGLRVPDVLLEGNHQKIALWRHAMSRERTERLRPDLLASPKQPY